MSLETIALVMLVVYLALLTGLSVLGAKRTTTFSDFAAASRAYGPAMAALVATATAASAITFMGVPGFGYSFGFSMLWFPMMWPVAVAIGFSIAARGIVRVQHNTGAVSIPDYLSERFADPAMRVIGAVATLALFWWVLGNFVGFGWLLSALFPVTYAQGVILGTVFTIGFVFIGGSHADVLTDAVQSVLMIALAIVVALVVLVPGILFDGGLSELNASLRGIDPALTASNVLSEHPLAESPVTLITLFLSMMFLGVTTAHGKYLISLRGSRQVRRFTMLYAVFGGLMGLTIFGGIAARPVLGEDVDPDQSLPLLFIESLPPFIAALLLVALLAGVMSTVDGVFLAMSVSVSGELYRKSYVPRFSKGLTSEDADRRSTIIARVTLLALAVLAMIFALQPPEFLVLLVWIGLGLMITALGPVLLLSGFLRWVTRPAAYASMIAGLGTYLPLLGLVGYDYVYVAIGTASVIGAAVFLVVSRFTSPPSEEFLARIFEVEKEE